MGGAFLNYENLIIILYGCKQVINSRPITNFSDDSRASITLTRMMFFQELLTFGLPEIDVLDSMVFDRRAKYCQRISDDLRNRFRIREEANKQCIHKYLAKII